MHSLLTTVVIHSTTQPYRAHGVNGTNRGVRGVRGVRGETGTSTCRGDPPVGGWSPKDGAQSRPPVGELPLHSDSPLAHCRVSWTYLTRHSSRTRAMRHDTPLLEPLLGGVSWTVVCATSVHRCVPAETAAEVYSDLTMLALKAWLNEASHGKRRTSPPWKA